MSCIRIFCAAVLALCAFALPGTALAGDTMNFGTSGTPNSYTESGFIVTSMYGGGSGHIHLDSGGLSIHGSCCSTPYEFRKTNNGVFTMTQLSRSGASGTLTSSSGGSQSFNGSGTLTLNSGFANVTWVRWAAGGGVIDNVVWTDCTAPSGAQAGGPYSVNEGSAVALSGSGAGSSLVYNWDFTGNSVYNNATGTSPSFSAATSAGSALDGTTTHTVGLQVTSSTCAGTSTDTATINVANVSPTVNATIPSTGTEGSSLSFSATGSDPGPDPLTYSWAFGDGGSSTTQNPSHTFTDNGTYNVTVTVNDGDGGTNSSTSSVTISNVNPTLASINGPVTATEGDTKNYTATVSDPSSVDTSAGFTYAWSLSGPSGAQTSASATPSFTFTDDGAHTLALTVTDKDGGADTSSISITVTNANPTASITGPTTGTEGQLINFTGSATDPGADTFTFAWAFGDGGAGTGANASHTYLNQGSYTITLTVTDDDGGVDSTTLVIAISNVNPTIDSFGVPASGAEGTTLVFTSSASDMGTLDTLTYTWAFGDGSASTSQNPAHVYTDNGGYTVSLTVTDGDGGSATTSTTLPISNVNPTLSAINGPVTATEGDTKNYSATVSDPSSVDTSAGFTYAWVLTDSSGAAGLTSSSETPSFTFANDDLYVVTLTVTDKDGGADTASINVNVSNAPPAAAISGPATGNEGQVISYVGSATDPGLFDNPTFAWAFGDGGTGTGPNVSHTYLDEGTYTITLTVTDGDGGVGSTTLVVVISNVNPTIDSFGVPASGAEGTTLAFTSSASDVGTLDTLTYTWAFGDGDSSTSQNPSHAYNDNGSYTVSLTVTDGDGGSATTSATLPISNVNPNISSINGPTTATEGDTKTYGATVTDPSSVDTGAGFTYAWSLSGPSGAQTSTSATPSFTFTDDGTHTLTLTVTDKDSGTDTDTLSITVLNAPPVASISGPTTGNEGQSLSFTGSVTDPGNDTFTYSWAFGDGTSGTGPNVSHTYADEGTGSYTVTLTVTDDDGGVGTTTQVVAVSNVPPTIDSFNVPASGVEASTLSFTSTASDVGTLDTLSHLWDFGDSTTSTSQNPSHAYADEGSGTYTVTLTVTDNDGGSVTTSTTTSIANVNPVAGAIVGPVTGNEGQSLSWTGSGTDVGTLDTLTYSWDFGDSTTSASGTAATHTYSDDGTYTITLTVTDNDGGTDTSTITVTIQNLAPTVTTISGPSSGDEGSSLTFSAVATDPGSVDQANLTLSWDWGDATASGIGPATSHAWDDEGSYTVTVTATDSGGLSGSATYTVTISNVAPTIVTNAPGFGDEAVLYSYQAGATDPGADTITWTLSASSPTGAVVNSSTGLVEWTPTFAQLGQNAFTITADDGDGGSDVQSWTVQVGFADTDGDGMADAWETDNGLDPTVDDSTLDPDGDGVTNLDEFLNGQDPNVSGLPDPPTLIDPIDGVEVADPRPTMVWDVATDPNGDVLTYDVEVYEDQAMALLVTTASELPDLSWQIDTPLSNENADYYWRVRSDDGWGAGIWSDLEDFFLNEYNEAPGMPTAVYPVGGETIGTLTPSAEMIEGVDIDRDDVSHRVRVWTLDGLEMLTEGWLAAGARNVSWPVDITLEEDTWYSWNAQAEDEHGLTSDWMELEDFFATSTNASPLDVHFIDPLDGDYLESVSPDLSYTQSSDPEGRTVEYEIDLDTSDAFDSGALIAVTLEHQETENGTWSLSDDGVELDENLWWNARVRAVDQDDGTSAWDLIRFFVRGDNDPPDVPVLISPEDGFTLDDVAPVLAVAHVEDPEGDLVLYELMVARDAELTDVIASVGDLLEGTGPEGTADQTSWRTEVNLTGTVYWSARAVDDRGAASDWAESWMLVLDNGEPISVPDPVADGCTCENSLSGGADLDLGLWLVLFLPAVLLRRRRGAR